MLNQPIKYTDVIELTLAAQNKINFLEQQQLRGARISGIYALCIDQIAKSPTTYGTPLSFTAAKNCYFTLVGVNEQQRQRVVTIPVSQLLPNNSTNNAAYSDKWTYLEPIEIDWPKSFITVGDTTAVTAATILTFIVRYEIQEGN
jgi:hypothetical protein